LIDRQTLTFCSEGIWPFSFVAYVEATYFAYRPRSDFLLLLEGYPFLFIEICSDRVDELDRFRMLLQAGILVRVMNSFKSDREGKFESFIAVAIYVNSKFIAERYLVGQPQLGTQSTEVRHQCLIVDVLAQIYYILQIKYVKDEFDLKTPANAFQFFFELHNLSSALPHDDRLSDAASKLRDLLNKVQGAKMPHFTSKSTKKRKVGEAKLGNSNAPPEDGTLDGGNTSLARGLSKLGIRLDSEEEYPGWTILNPVRSSAFIG
jgi:hypothetical protein